LHKEACGRRLRRRFLATTQSDPTDHPSSGSETPPTRIIVCPKPLPTPSRLPLSRSRFLATEVQRPQVVEPLRLASLATLHPVACRRDSKRGEHASTHQRCPRTERRECGRRAVRPARRREATGSNVWIRDAKERKRLCTKTDRRRRLWPKASVTVA
jgi:hypothetical protein